MVLEYAASPRLHDCNSGTEKSVCICNNYSGPQSCDHQLWSSELAADKDNVEAGRKLQIMLIHLRTGTRTDYLTLVRCGHAIFVFKIVLLGDRVGSPNCDW